MAVAQVGMKILGVVENMSGLQQPLASMQFMSQSAGDKAPRDVTQELLALLKGSALNAEDIVARSEIFKPTKGGAEHMAADMDIPFLGRVPLDPALSLAGTCHSHLSHVPWECEGTLQIDSDSAACLALILCELR